MPLPFSAIIANRPVLFDYFCNHPPQLASVARWCAAEWPWYYGNGDFMAACAYHKTTLTCSAVPLGIIALSGRELAGTISLLEDDMEDRKELSPWLGCLFVDPAWRHCGLGAALIEKGIEVARHIGVKKIYAWTELDTSSASQSGWKLAERRIYRGRSVSILVRNLQDGVADGETER